MLQFRGDDYSSRVFVPFALRIVRLNTGLHFRPQCRTVRRQALQQARVGVLRRFSLTIGMAAGSFNRAEHALGCHQKVDVLLFAAFGWVHNLDFTSFRSTA